MHGEGATDNAFRKEPDMRTTFLYLAMTAMLIGAAILIMPKEIGTRIGSAAEDLLGIDFNSEIRTRKPGAKEIEAMLEPPAPDRSMAAAFEPYNAPLTPREKQIEQGMPVDDVIAEYGEPIARSEDGTRLNYGERVVVLGDDDRVIGWIDRDPEVVMAMTGRADSPMVALNSGTATEPAGRFLNPFATRAVARVARSTGSSEYARTTARDRLWQTRYAARRWNSQTSAKPEWLRAFTRSLDRSHDGSRNSGVLYTGRPSFQHINYSNPR